MKEDIIPNIETTIQHIKVLDKQHLHTKAQVEVKKKINERKMKI